MTDRNRNRTWDEVRDQMNAADPELGEAYEESRGAFLVARELMRARQRLGLTQAQVAERVGTTQSVISRIERMDTTPSLTTVQRIATALELQLEIRFVEPSALSSIEDMHEAMTSVQDLMTRLAAAVQRANQATEQPHDRLQELKAAAARGAEARRTEPAAG